MSSCRRTRSSVHLRRRRGRQRPREGGAPRCDSQGGHGEVAQVRQNVPEPAPVPVDEVLAVGLAGLAPAPLASGSPGASGECSASAQRNEPRTAVRVARVVRYATPPTFSATRSLPGPRPGAPGGLVAARPTIAVRGERPSVGLRLQGVWTFVWGQTPELSRVWESSLPGVGRSTRGRGGGPEKKKPPDPAPLARGPCPPPPPLPPRRLSLLSCAGDHS